MDPLTAFVSYSHEDEDFAVQLAKDLRANGQEVWMDRLDLRPGQRWENEISAALSRCRRLLVILSPASVGSFNVLKEVTNAIYSRKELLPVLYRDCDIPLQLRPYFYADFRKSYNDGLKDLQASMTQGQQAPATSSAANTPGGRSTALPLQPPSPDDADGGTKKSTGQDAASEDSGKDGNMEEGPQAGEAPQPLSAASYAWIAGIGLIVAAAFTLFYIYQVPRLIESGAQGQIFYLLLIPWALASSAFLFGAMKSYARFTNKHLGSFLELGGPVVLFALVMVGGFKLVPASAEMFDLTVRPHSEDGRNPIITTGKITLDLDNDRRTAQMGGSGEADFKAVPGKFKGTALKVLPQVDGYEEKWQQVTPQGNVVDLALVRAALPETVLKGRINPPQSTKKKVRIFVEGQTAETTADDVGRFELRVNGKPGDVVRIEVYVDGKSVYDDNQVLPGPVELRLHKPG